MSSKSAPSQARPIWDACTDCQRQVVIVLACTGGSNEQIAHALGITAAQVKGRLRRIYDKLKIRRRSALATAYIIECQIAKVQLMETEPDGQTYELLVLRQGDV